MNLTAKVTLLLTTVVASTVAAQSQEAVERSVLTERSLQTFVTTLEQKGASAADFEAFGVPRNSFQLQQSKEDLTTITEGIEKLSRELNVRSIVRISTTGGAGATVKYQTLGERRQGEEPITASSVTATTESMYLGIYYIWSERHGTPTSDRNARINIDELQERVILEER